MFILLRLEQRISISFSLMSLLKSYFVMLHSFQRIEFIFLWHCIVKSRLEQYELAGKLISTSGEIVLKVKVKVEEEEKNFPEISFPRESLPLPHTSLVL